jgi:hypothetical protein
MPRQGSIFAEAGCPCDVRYSAEKIADILRANAPETKEAAN